MTLNEKQQKIMDTYLFTDNLSSSEDEPRLTLELNRRQLRFLIQAVDHFFKSQCPMAELGQECSMLSWEENVPTGALERVCAKDCNQWIEELLSKIVPEGFTPRR